MNTTESVVGLREARLSIERGCLGEGLSRRGYILTVELTDFEAESLLCSWWSRLRHPEWRPLRQRALAKIANGLYGSPKT